MMTDDYTFKSQDHKHQIFLVLYEYILHLFIHNITCKQF